MGFPFVFWKSLGVVHDLTSPLDVASHFEVLGVLNKSCWHLLLRRFITTSLDCLSWFVILTHQHLQPWGYQPEFPLYIFRACENCISQVTYSLFIITHPLKCLCCFNKNFPLQLPRHIWVHVVENGLEIIKTSLSQLLRCLFIQTEILEPQRRVLRIKIQPLFTVRKSFLKATFSFLVPARLKVNRSVSYCVTNLSEHLPSFLNLAYPALKLGAFNLNAPLITFDKFSDLFVFTFSLHHFDAFDDQVFIFLAVLETLVQKNFA